MEPQNKKETEQIVMPGLLFQVKVKEGKGQEFATELRNVIPNVRKEEGTLAWFGFRINETDFGTLDVFIDEEARQIHKRKRDERERTNKLLPLVEEGSLVIKEIDIISYKFDRK